MKFNYIRFKWSINISNLKKKFNTIYSLFIWMESQQDKQANALDIEAILKEFIIVSVDDLHNNFCESFEIDDYV